jgi:hypothetical protein
MEHSLFLPETRISDSARSLLSTSNRLHLVYEFALTNNALERTVKGFRERAAGARRDFTPAARWFGLALPAQRGR